MSAVIKEWRQRVAGHQLPLDRQTVANLADAEIAELRAALATSAGRIDSAIALAGANEQINDLRAALADAERDAKRYRWLRDADTDVALVLDKRTEWVPEDESVAGAGGYYIYEYRAGDELDNTIDAAMSAQEQGEKK